MAKINYGIIGCGRIAKRHAEIIAKTGVLKAVCDIKLDKAKEFADTFNSVMYIDINDLLKNGTDIEVISVCTPNGLHAEHSILSLRAGKHVLCEKPMAISVEDCEKMIIESDKAGKHLFIVKQNRFNPPVEALKRVIDEGRLGKIINIEVNCFWNRNEKYYNESDWKGKKTADGGTLYTQFSHFIDLMYWLAGDVEIVQAFGKNLIHGKLIEFEDTGVIILRFLCGALGTINYTVNSYKKNMEGSIAIFGEKGTVKIGGQYLNILEYQCIKDYDIKGLPESRPANDYGFYQGSMSNHEKVYENITDVLHNGGKIAANAYEGMKTVEIISKIYQQMEQSNRV